MGIVGSARSTLLLGATLLGSLLALPAHAQDRAADGLEPPALTPRVSRIVAGYQAERARSSLDVATRFDPALDVPPISNTGDYASDGDCLALTLLAIEAHDRRLRGEASPFVKGNEPYLKALVSQLQSRLAEEWTARDVNAGNPRRPWSDPSVGQGILESLKAGRPAILDFKVQLRDGRTGSHAVLAHSYKDGKFVLYDPDQPESPQTVEWSPETGFGRLSQPKFQTPLAATLRAPGEFQAAAGIAALEKACASLDASCMGRYRPTSVSATPEGGSLVVRGTVGAPGVRPRNEGSMVFATVRVNRQPLLSVIVARDGTFTAKVPSSALGGRPGLIEVEVKLGDGGLVGIGRVQVPAPSSKGITKALERR